ncbi:hypothetical protein [Roseivivax marinus]|uniref:hypothetical protein n=1 Tax=Roseivivax marinus TaxID=1379903 RepID=UPI00273E2BCA|nr:hypothetical protein [Roseivivax marinus]
MPTEFRGSPIISAEQDDRHRELAGFIAVEVHALHELLNACGEIAASLALLEVAELQSSDIRDLPRIADDLTDVLEALARISFESLETAGRGAGAPANLHGALCYFGARLTDLAGRYPAFLEGEQ